MTFLLVTSVTNAAPLAHAFAPSSEGSGAGVKTRLKLPERSSKAMERGVPAVARAYVRAKVLSLASCSSVG